jgi:ABC-type Mn2+/Zn2+ transport system permease subunit
MIVLFAFSCVALACAMLSLVVVARRWAFIGEGIGHSGFGGAGTAWLLMALFPALDQLRWLPYASVVLFALLAAIGMGAISRRGQVSGDAAVGIFLVATVAWGFLGQQVYRQRMHVEPIGFSTLFFGQPQGVTAQFATAAAGIAIAVGITLVALRKEIIAYCVDPQLAEVSGVRIGFIHYLLMTLVAVTTIVGMQVVGTLLITALLVLPGATAQLVAKRLSYCTAASLAVGLLGAVGGHTIHRAWPAVPIGPAMVLVMVAAFVMALAAGRARR